MSPSSERSLSDDEQFELHEIEPGYVLGERYRIEGVIGGGGIGAVYRAVQLPLERPVAIKVLHDDLLELTELRKRFEREARVLSALTHPNVVSISDYGIDGDRPYLVMELLEGRTLEELLRKEKLEPAHAFSLAHQVLEGLAFAHDKGIAHRDLKPANVFLQKTARDDREHVKLLDFGLARMVSTDLRGPDDVTLTKRGVVFGTPAYMSPEQASGMPAEERSDVYTMGILLFEMLAGRRPFVGETRAELLRGHLADPLPRLASIRPELRAHADLVELLDVATAKTPADRYPSAGAMLAALDALPERAAWLVETGDISGAQTQISVKPPKADAPAAPVAPTGNRIGVGVLAGVVAALLVVGGTFLWERLDEPPPPPPPQEIAGPIEPAAPAPPDRQPPRDPFQGYIPEPLLPYHAMVEDGYVFEDRAEIRPLYALVREMPDDPRPLLLLAHLFTLRGWYSNAIVRYERAVEMDESVRGDPHMLDALLTLSANESVGDRAAEAVERIYGPEALPALESVVTEHTGQALPQLRLVRLRERLEAME